MTLPEPVFPQYPELLHDPGPETPLEKRDWTTSTSMAESARLAAAVCALASDAR